MAMSGQLEMFQDLIFWADLGTCGGISGGLEINGLGTFILKLDDDTGRRHTIIISNSLYIPDLKQTLVCPQHWAHEANDYVPEQEGVMMHSYLDIAVLMWNQRQFKRTIPLDNAPISPTIMIQIGTYYYQAFCAFVECFHAKPCFIE